ncbi:hypothetical protein D9V86_03560 [Bacteroidetes/Chlorobi group bacterium ChocPot_Mid]|jgi:uncharacterized protein YoxC|nr:MAG: hypothetical protein D9V86_03560 [Bacteroidetes/Chlorobi group bacterium ChocPot_Mid]
MDIALKIVALSALIAFILLSIFAIISLVGALRSMKDITSNIERLSRQLDISLKQIRDDFDQITNRLSQSLDNLDSATMQIASTTKSLQNGTDGILKTVNSYTGLFNRLYEKIALPVNEVILYSSAIGKAVTTFTSFFKGRNK